MEKTLSLCRPEKKSRTTRRWSHTFYCRPIRLLSDRYQSSHDAIWCLHLLQRSGGVGTDHSDFEKRFPFCWSTDVTVLRQRTLRRTFSYGLQSCDVVQKNLSSRQLAIFYTHVTSPQIITDARRIGSHR